MKSFVIGSIQISFASAVVTVARKIEHHDWNDEEGADAMFTTDSPWGKLVAINWSALHYVPGGEMYYLLPTNHPAVDPGALKLDWPTVEIKPLVTHMPNPSIERTRTGKPGRASHVKR